MTAQASLSLRGRNPDVLTCIANLSNDEVFTPPEFAGRMLDTLAAGWAAGNGGADIWADSSVRFLDPCTKSGVFLREIATRLIKGLADEIPDLQTRVDHILTKQIFGIGITRLTGLLARRSLYCSKFATGEHSVAKGFASDDGNVWFERTEHEWVGGKCGLCGAPNKEPYDRSIELENYAYPFLHTNDVNMRLVEMFGGEMQFDVIIGNPPYQLKGGGGGTNDSSIYPQFVEQAMTLEPRYLSMVVPSRWLAGGRDLGAFRQRMLTGGHVREFVDYTKMSTAFPGVDFEGGVGYFLWDRDTSGPCNYSLTLGDELLPTVQRRLDEHDIFVRDTRALSILKKVRNLEEPTMGAIISGDTPFGLASNFADYSGKERKDDLAIYLTVKGRRTVAWVSDHFVAKAREFAPLRSAPLVVESPRPENTGPTKFGKGEPPSEFAKPEKLKHTDRRVLSPIQLDLWNKANWHGTAFMQYPDMPGPILALHFRDADAARRIFEDWRDRWGIEGSDDNVRISIITGVTKANPYAYSMQIGPVYRTSDEQSGKTFMTMSRTLRLDASTPNNLNRFLEAFQKAGSYGLVAAFTPPGEDFPTPMTELLLPRRKLEVRPAWMIDENDPDLSVMQNDDDPFIPEGMADPPVMRAMARLRQFRQRQAAS